MTAASVSGQAPDPRLVESRADLKLPGRVLVGLIAVAGLGFALQGDFSLLWYIPYASVGVLLAIRRPRTSIGWLLLASGWGFAIVQVPVHATPAALASGSIDPLTQLLVVLGVAAGPAVFLLFGALAVVFPSGRLPGGRWGTVARAGLVVGVVTLALGLLMPTLVVTPWESSTPVIARNPLALLPDLPLWRVVTNDTFLFPIVVVMAGATVSLFVRYRRAVGIERQQLRWITAALSAVVIGVVGGLTLATAFPAAGQSGVVWLGAALAFPLVPIAIGFAVLRYRLYEIDTIINRAIVYALLTAVLAGASAAVIAVTRQVFEGVIGPGSDLSVVISTLVVVSAFEPVKKRIQALVDRRFKESVDPRTAMDALVAEIRSSVGRPDPERSLRRFLGEAISAFRAASGTLEWSAADGSAGLFRFDATERPRAGSTALVAVPPVEAVARAGAFRAKLELEDVSDAGAAAVLEPALAAVLVELGGVDPSVNPGLAPTKPPRLAVAEAAAD